MVKGKGQQCPFLFQDSLQKGIDGFSMSFFMVAKKV